MTLADGMMFDSKDPRVAAAREAETTERILNSERIQYLAGRIMLDADKGPQVAALVRVVIDETIAILSAAQAQEIARLREQLLRLDLAERLVATSKAESDTLRQQLAEAREAVESLVQGGECEFHAAGRYCMTHKEKATPGECPHQKALTWLRALASGGRG